MAEENQQKQGLAIGSLVLGILSLACFGLLTGIPAIVMGHIAHNRSQRQPAEYGGSGLAIAGFILGYAGTVVGTAIMAGMLLPALASAKQKAEEFKCEKNLEQIVYGANMYANDQGGKLPSSFMAIQQYVQGSAGVLVCPSDDSIGSTPSDWEAVESGNVTYQWVAPQAEVEAGSTDEVPLVMCPIHQKWGYADGRIAAKGSE